MPDDDMGMMGPSGDLVLSLHEMNGSGQSGVVVLTANGNQTDVTIIATTGISELNHIHSGSCMDLGGVTYPLTSMANGTSVTTVDASLDTLTAGDLAFNLHKAGDPGTYTACIEIPTKDQFVTVSLAELDASGQSGIASLIARGNQTEVVLYATAAISELNHIHSGSCMDLGGVSYPLTSMVNGMSVTTVDAPLDTLTAGDLAINLHKTGDPGTYTSCSEIPVKDMIAGDMGMMGPSGDLVLSLHELNGSGQTGIVVLTANGNQTDVTIIATTGISELNHIHSGSCMDLGGVSYPLTSMANGTSVTTVDASLDTLTAGDLAFNLHKAGDPGTYTACIEIPTKDQFVTVSLHEMSESGQSGIASLIARGNQTEVILYATAAISELNHIHSGSCMDLGGVSYPLTSMANGMSVTTVDAPLDTLTAGDLAINLHKTGDPGTYTSCSEIPVKDMMSAAQTVEANIASFNLPDIEVALGTTVTWTNQDGAPHTTTSGQNGQFAGPGWDSSTLSNGQSFSHTFDQAGTFAYTCTIHPSMNGTVTVTEGAM